jgi:hypothetical protein
VACRKDGELMWTDLMLDRALDDRPLREGLASIFGVPADEIQIVGGSADGGGTAGTASDHPIWVERDALEGEFPLRLGVYLRPDLCALIDEPADEQAAIARLCAVWQASCLFSDDEVNPYTWLVMRPNGRLEAVTVDAESLDDRDAFIVTRVDRVIRLMPTAV